MPLVGLDVVQLQTLESLCKHMPPDNWQLACSRRPDVPLRVGCGFVLPLTLRISSSVIQPATSLLFLNTSREAPISRYQLVLDMGDPRSDLRDGIG